MTPALSQGINRQRTRAAKNQRHQTSDVKQVDFVTRRAKLGSLRTHREPDQIVAAGLANLD